MNIEESVKKNPEKFEKVLAGKKEDIEFAFKDLSQKLDIVIWGAIAEYAKAEAVDANVDEMAAYEHVKQLISKNIDKTVGEYLHRVGKLPA